MGDDVHVGILVVLGFTITTALIVIACMFQFSRESSASEWWMLAPTLLCAALIGIAMKVVNRGRQ